MDIVHNFYRTIQLLRLPMNNAHKISNYYLVIIRCLSSVKAIGLQEIEIERLLNKDVDSNLLHND